MNTQVTQLMLLAQYQEQRQHIFPSPMSLEWFVRKQRPELVKSGALLMLTGRWHANPEKFDACLIRLGSQAARAHGRSEK